MAASRRLISNDIILHLPQKRLSILQTYQSRQVCQGRWGDWIFTGTEPILNPTKHATHDGENIPSPMDSFTTQKCLIFSKWPPALTDKPMGPRCCSPVQISQKTRTWGNWKGNWRTKIHANLKRYWTALVCDFCETPLDYNTHWYNRKKYT